MDVQEAIKAINIDIITDLAAKTIITQLLNIIEYQAQEIKIFKQENQQLKNEINRLKGEQGKPDINPQTKGLNNISSEKERNNKGKGNKNKKSKTNKQSIKVDRVVKLEMDLSQLPEDAVFKGYRSVVVQDIIIKTDNIQFQKAVYYSVSLNKTFTALLPVGYNGEFGPYIKSLIITQHFVYKMTEPAIVQFLQCHGIQISAATASRMITDNHEQFHAEKNTIVQAGLPSSIYQQMDDTGARINGQNNYTHVLCNQYYTAYFTRSNKDRLTILEILAQREPVFEFSELSYALMIQMDLSYKILDKLKNLNPDNILNRLEVNNLLSKLFEDPSRYNRSRQIILEASAIIAYQRFPGAIKILLADNAPQFKKITELLALCWVHDGRHYKKLTPIISINQSKLDCFLSVYWDYYHKLLEYKQAPTQLLAESLSKEFDNVFSISTGYDQLDQRITRTKLKKDSLLLVLQHPELPLHNNESELGARTQARYRDISFQTKNKKGTECKDTFMTIVATAKKQGVNAFNYIVDRISKKFEMPSLASLIGAHNSS